MSDKSGTSADILSLPDGGGALAGIGESFSPDLFTGTGNFSVPISVPSGRNGFQPDLKLVYSSGSGNGPFGLGWSLSVPGVSRKTSKGVPTYQGKDTFVLSGAEDLVKVAEELDDNNNVVKETYRPRTEGLFARIERHRPSTGGDWWEVHTKSGNTSYYGTPNTPTGDPAALCDPNVPSKIFSWRLSQTVDPFGNQIRYTYLEDTAEVGPHDYTQLYPHKIEYVDHGDAANPDFLVEVEFVWENRLIDDDPAQPIDPFSTYRQGFEVRTTKRCQEILVRSNHFTDTDATIRTYRLEYADPGTLTNNLSILERVIVEGQAGTETQQLPPLEFSYNDFNPSSQRFEAIAGNHLPQTSLGSPILETVDLFGNGLPDLVEMSGQFIRYWRNRGDGTFDWPRQMKTGPAGLSLADPGVQFIDAEGNGRADLMVSRPNHKGYFPLTFEGNWDEDGFVPYKQAPSVGFEDPEVKLMDLTGDGLTDVVRTGTSFECFFNHRDPDKAWGAEPDPELDPNPRRLPRKDIEDFPDVRFSDSRVRTADMTGDGLQDIVLIHSGHIDYWPNLGYGRFGKRVHMKGAPRFPWGYRPEHVLVGDVDGDGAADLIHIQDGCVTVWMNQSGNSFSDPISIQGTPRVTDQDAVRLIDLKGTGCPGILWSRNTSAPGRANMHFLDFTGGKKPYLLNEMNNHMGAVTRVAYRPSTEYYLEDDRDPTTRWKTPLPFPVQTVWRVEVIDQISKGKLTTEYEYHHGYWDGEEREFRGFARVVQRDSESFADYASGGLARGDTFEDVLEEDFSPPMETRHWFMLGGVWDAANEWSVPDFSEEWWAHADSANHPNQLLGDWAYEGNSDDPATLQAKLDSLSVDRRREALRALRGRKIRSEMYALDHDVDANRADKPFVVTESIHSFRDLSTEAFSGEDHGIFFSYSVASRTTNWDRGDDPATSFEWSDDYDAYGQPRKTTAIACPRGWTRPDVVPPEPFLATHATTTFIEAVGADQYMVDRTEESSAWEIVDGGSNTLISLKAAVDDGTAQTEIQSHSITYYDGPAFEGLAKGEIGAYGAAVRAESLVMTDDIVAAAYPSGEGGAPVYLDAETPTWPAEYPDEFKSRIDAMSGRAGYRYDSTTGHYYAVSGRTMYDFQEGTGVRGLPVQMKNPVGHLTDVTYDTYGLLPTQVDSTLSSTNTTFTTTATYDYRLFKPVEVTDVNDNRTKVAYTPLGLVDRVAVMGKTTETIGDTLQVQGKSFVYDLTFSPQTGSQPAKPVSVTTIVREYHVNSPAGGVPSWASGDETIESVEFSDGFGRVVQTRAQAEELDYERADDDNHESAGLPPQYGSGIDDAIPTTDPDRVRVSGWQRYNNKGKVVEKWEPFFASGFSFGDIPKAHGGKSVKVRFDARGRQVRTIRPDGAESLVVFGEVPDVTQPEAFIPTSWQTYAYDANDNAGRTTIVGVDSTTFSSHYNTPTSTVVDALGRTIETIERTDAGNLVTQTTYDIRDNVLTVVDPKQRTAARQFYDLADRTLRGESIDAGTSIAAFDAAGTPIEARDARGALTLTAADEMLRTTHQWGRDASTDPVRLVGRTLFGHEMTNPKATNHLGKPHRHFDEAGVVTLEAYDFKGNVLEKMRETIDPQLMIDAVDAADSANGYVVDTFRVDWTPATGETLSDREATLIDNSLYRTAYESKTIFDALNRPVEVTLPADEEDALDGYGKTITPRFNRAGALQSVAMSGTDNTPLVDYIAYNARGQRILTALGNGVMCRYAYDENVFRLSRMRSEKYASSSTPETGYTLPTDGTGKKYQDIVYAYDAVGNILSTDARVTDIGVAGADTMVRDFAYDALYRLLSATGRESDVQKIDPWQDQLTVKSMAGYDDSPANTRQYTETYAYDEVGGLTQLVHAYGASSAQWVRDYTTEAGSNRMTGLEVSGNTYTYAYDSGGNLVQENTERHFEWDFGGRMRAFRNQVSGSAATVFAHHSYDGGGQRVHKVVTRGAKTTRTVYIGGVFEHQQVIENDAVTVENQTLHLMDDAKRIATYRVGAELDGVQRPATRYHLGDHLQSSSVVLRQEPDGDGKLFVNREEYRPYGETAFGSFKYKRYRFTGKEKDEESGLHYHGARYYAPWAARWTAPDPLGMVDGPNLYQYVSGNPVRLVDPGGTNENEGGQEGSADTSPEVCRVTQRDLLQNIADDPEMPAKARRNARDELQRLELMDTLAAKTSETENGGNEEVNEKVAGSQSYVGSVFVRSAGARSEYIKANKEIPEKLLSEAGEEVSDEMADRAIKMRRANEIKARGTVRNKALNVVPETRNLKEYGDVYGPRSKEHFDKVRAEKGKPPKTNKQIVKGAGRTNTGANRAAKVGGVLGFGLMLLEAFSYAEELEDTGSITVSPGVRFAPTPATLQDGTRAIGPRGQRGTIYNGRFMPDGI